jgi:hypothetical protein
MKAALKQDLLAAGQRRKIITQEWQYGVRHGLQLARQVVFVIDR